MKKLSVAFIGLALLTGVACANTNNESSVGWTNSTITDEFDDSITIGVSSDPGVLTVMFLCGARLSTGVMVNRGFLTLDGTVSVRYRFDDEQAVSAKWVADSPAIFADDSVVFLRQALRHKSLLLEVSPPGVAPIRRRFSLEGLDDASKPVREACQVRVQE